MKNRREEWPPLSERPNFGEIALTLSVLGVCCWLIFLAIDFLGIIFNDPRDTGPTTGPTLVDALVGGVFIYAFCLWLFLLPCGLLVGLFGLPNKRAGVSIGIVLSCWAAQVILMCAAPSYFQMPGTVH